MKRDGKKSSKLSKKDQKPAARLVMTVRDPSKTSETLCKQLKKVFTPNCLTKLETNPRMQDVIDVSDQLHVRQIVHISEHEIKIACLPKGPTYTFSIVEYDNMYKNYPAEFYKLPAFVTMEGRSNYGHIFQHFGKNEAGFQRALHFFFSEDLVHVRHYCTSVEDLDEKFKVGLKEIGPRLTLKFRDVRDGVFPEMKIKKTRYYKKTPKK